MAVELKILERIQKLLALSQSSNEHEASNALARAQALLAQHNLSMAQVQARTGQKSSYLRETYDVGGRDVWRRSLIQSIAHSNFCSLVVLGEVSVSLIGESENMQVVQVMYHFIATQLERLAVSGWQSYQQSGGRTPVRTWKNNFYHGANGVIRQRLKAEQQAFEASSNGCRALLVIKDQDLREAVQHFYPRLKKLPRSTYRSAPDGYASGAAAGREVQFRGQVGQGRQGK